MNIPYPNFPTTNIFDAYAANKGQRLVGEFRPAQIRVLAESQRIIWKSQTHNRQLWSTLLQREGHHRAGMAEMAMLGELAVILMAPARGRSPWEENNPKQADHGLLVATMINFELHVSYGLAELSVPSRAAKVEARALSLVALSVIVARRLGQPDGGNPRWFPELAGIAQVYEVLNGTAVDEVEIEDRLGVLTEWCYEFLRPRIGGNAPIHKSFRKLCRLLLATPNRS
jgi:hypothetical protein